MNPTQMKQEYDDEGFFIFRQSSARFRALVARATDRFHEGPKHKVVHAKRYLSQRSTGCPVTFFLPSPQVGRVSAVDRLPPK